MNDVDSVLMWEEPVKLDGLEIPKHLILAAADGQISVAAKDREFVVMVELHPAFYEGAVVRVAVPYP